MKRHCLLFCVFTALFFSSFADDGSTARINLGHQGHDNHIEHFIPADMPEVYFDSDNLEIILVADGFSSYYDVEITQTGYNVPLISTQVDGYGDTIDVSSLPDDDYTIIITSEFNNVFEGTFHIE